MVSIQSQPGFDKIVMKKTQMTAGKGRIMGGGF